MRQVPVRTVTVKLALCGAGAGDDDGFGEVQKIHVRPGVSKTQSQNTKNVENTTLSVQTSNLHPEVEASISRP